MPRRGNRYGPVRVSAGPCLAALALTWSAAALSDDDWHCHRGGDQGWVCAGTAAPTRLAAARPTAVALDAAFSARPAEPTADRTPSGRRQGESGSVAAPEPSTDVEWDGELGGLAESLWVRRDELAPARAAAIPEFCGGGYLSFTYPFPRDTNPDAYPLRAAAERADYVLDGDIDLEGRVQLEQGNRTLHAARATIDQAARQGLADGGVRLSEPGVVMQGQRAQVNLDTHAARLEDVEFVLLDSEFRGRARTLSEDGGGSLTMDDGTFTRCEPGNGNWRIDASRVTVKEDEVFGTARNAVVRMRGLPVFYTPYIRFPVTDDRQSGWLFPNIAYSGEDGADVSLPYYLNLAPNYDATVLPRYVGKRGPGLEAQFRHLSAWEETTLSGAFLYRDDLYNGLVDRKDFEELLAQGQITGEFNPADRWLYAMDHSGGFGNFTTRVDYTAVSDRDYFRDLGSDLGVSSQIELERRGEIQYAAGGLSMRLWAQRFQRLDETTVDPYQRLPELDVNYGGDLPGPLEWSLGTSFVTFTRENDDLVGSNAVVGDRVHVEPRLRLPLSRPWGFLTLAGGYRYTRYDLRDVPAGTDAEPDRKIGLGSAHAGLFFERELTAFDTSLVQTLEPQVYYLYQEFAPQDQLPRFDASDLTFGFSQLFRDNRFAGLDRIGDADQLSIGLTSRFLNGLNGREYFRASLGTITYFEDRRVTLSGNPGEAEMQSTSAIAGEVSANVAGHWSTTGALVWDPHQRTWDEGALALQYRRDNRHIVNLGYRKRVRGDIQQSDLSLYWPVTRRYAVMGRWNYDLMSGRTIEGFAGIEYNDCCWRVRLMARRFLDAPTGRNLDDVRADEGIFLQIVFKGLAGFGDKMESVLSRGIRGYRTETTYDF